MPEKIANEEFWPRELRRKEFRELRDSRIRRQATVGCATSRYHGLAVYLRGTHRKKGRHSKMDRKSMVSKGSTIETTDASFIR